MRSLSPWDWLLHEKRAAEEVRRAVPCFSTLQCCVMSQTRTVQQGGRALPVCLWCMLLIHGSVLQCIGLALTVVLTGVALCFSALTRCVTTWTWQQLPCVSVHWHGARHHGRRPDRSCPMFQCIDKARDIVDTDLTAMAGESYNRAYAVMVNVQMLSELEEIIQYKLVPERRQAIKEMWWERLKVCGGLGWIGIGVGRWRCSGRYA